MTTTFEDQRQELLGKIDDLMLARAQLNAEMAEYQAKIEGWQKPKGEGR